MNAVARRGGSLSGIADLSLEDHSRNTDLTQPGNHKALIRRVYPTWVIVKALRLSCHRMEQDKYTIYCQGYSFVPRASLSSLPATHLPACELQSNYITLFKKFRRQALISSFIPLRNWWKLWARRISARKKHTQRCPLLGCRQGHWI